MPIGILRNCANIDPDSAVVFDQLDVDEQGRVLANLRESDPIFLICDNLKLRLESAQQLMQVHTVAQFNKFGSLQRWADFLSTHSKTLGTHFAKKMSDIRALIAPFTRIFLKRLISPFCILCALIDKQCTTNASMYRSLLAESFASASRSILEISSCMPPPLVFGAVDEVIGISSCQADGAKDCIYSKVQ